MAWIGAGRRSLPHFTNAEAARRSDRGRLGRLLLSHSVVWPDLRHARNHVGAEGSTEIDHARASSSRLVRHASVDGFPEKSLLIDG